uniref:BPI2 domain-containing protein n=1 Tax=Heterorhabditis bacteriophora TaxID=37862 RepID=A0A1I7WY20_HETBA
MLPIAYKKVNKPHINVHIVGPMNSRYIDFDLNCNTAFADRISYMSGFHLNLAFSVDAFTVPLRERVVHVDIEGFYRVSSALFSFLVGFQPSDLRYITFTFPQLSPVN